MMTETRCEVELIKAIWNVLPNTTLETVLEESALRVGAPQFDEDDLAFAEEISKTFVPGQREASLRKERLPAELFSQVLKQHVGVKARRTVRYGGLYRCRRR
jgi:aminobenzoyl-glutamate utilization protein B